MRFIQLTIFYLVLFSFISNEAVDLLSDYSGFGIEKKMVESDDSSSKDDSNENKDLPYDVTFLNECSSINMATIVAISYKNQNIFQAILSRNMDIKTPPPRTCFF